MQNLVGCIFHWNATAITPAGSEKVQNQGLCKDLDFGICALVQAMNKTGIQKPWAFIEYDVFAVRLTTVLWLDIETDIMVSMLETSDFLPFLLTLHVLHPS